MKNSTLKDPRPSDMSIYIVRNIAHTYSANDALDNPYTTMHELTKPHTHRARADRTRLAKGGFKLAICHAQPNIS